MAAPFSPETAVEAGFLDEVADADQLEKTAAELATSFAALDMAAHRASKLHARAATLVAIRSAIDADFAAAG